EGPAVEAFARAFELDPQYEFAGIMLFDKQLETGDVSAAADTLRRLRLHSTSSFVVARAVQLAAKRGNLDEALGLLREVCTAANEGQWPIAAACEAIQEMGDKATYAVRTTLRELAKSPDANA